MLTQSVSECSAYRGILWLEGCMKNGVDCDSPEEFERKLSLQLSSSPVVCETWENILELQDAEFVLGDMYSEATRILSTLKIVEYRSPPPLDTAMAFKESTIHLFVYELFDDARNFSKHESQEIPMTEITHLPHESLKNKWEELIYDVDIKNGLIQIMNNLRRFHSHSDMIPLILLHGPPGTGKTTLSESLAQKMSIRLRHIYASTKLISVKTPSLTSKYLGQSAKIVADIFDSIHDICMADDQTFIFVLLDEVESIANSRQSSKVNGEPQDTVRATNALLTGIDQFKMLKNVMVLATSNMADTLDPAFLTRCAKITEIKQPSEKAQFAILRDRLQNLLNTGIIKKTDTILPAFAEARNDFVLERSDTPGYRIHKILKGVNSLQDRNQVGWEMCGRSLAALPQTALVEHMCEDREWTLNDTFDCLEAWLAREKSHPVSQSEPQIQTQKRGLTDINGSEQDCSFYSSHSGSKKKKIVQEGEFSDDFFLRFAKAVQSEKDVIPLIETPSETSNDDESA